MTKPKTVILSIGNTKVEIGKKYSLSNRFDATAPDGMQKIKATKFPFDMNDNKECVSFDETSGLYDTGLHEQSRDLKSDRKLSQEEIRERISSYKTHIATPYSKIKNKDLSPDSDFWKEYRFDVYVNREFDTTDVTQLFDLFNIIMQGAACNEGELDPLYKKMASFNITSIQDVKDKKKESTKSKRDAVTVFNTMVDSNKEKLDVVLGFINKGSSSNIEPDDLKDIYYDIINHPDTGADFIKRFTEACNKYEDEVGKLEMEYFSMAQKLLVKNKIKKVGSRYMTMNETDFLGNSLQDIAQFCLKADSKQREIITDLYEGLE